MEEFSDSQYITIIYGICRLFAAFSAFFIYSLCQNRRSHLPAFTYLQSFFLCMGCWDLLKGLFYLSPEYSWLPKVPFLIYIFTPFTNIAFFYFCFTYVFPKKIHYIKYFKLLYIMPVILSICIIIPSLQNHFITFTDKIVYIPYRDYQKIMHWGIYVFLGFFHIITFAEIIFGFYRLRKKGFQNKLQTCMLLLVLFLFLLQNLTYNFVGRNLSVWFSLVISIFALFSCYGIILTDPEEQTISAAQENLLKTMPFPIFILNKQGKILYANNHAKIICSGLEYLFDEPRYKSDIIKQFQQQDLWRNQEYYSEKQNTILLDKETNTPYYLYEQNFEVQRRHKTKCSLMMMFTIEEMHMFFDDLETKAFRDGLCGCYNRHFLTMKMGDFAPNKTAATKYFPLTFILGDIDGLKQVNDTLGHTVGDEYILLCYNAMREKTRKIDYIFRLGGDEFLVILPQSSEHTANDIIGRIENEILQLGKQVSYNPSISLGSYTIETLPIDIHQCIKAADEAMYKRKQQKK